MDKPRGTTRALVLAPTRELAAQIERAPRAASRRTRRITAPPVFGGVGMGPQEQRLPARRRRHRRHARAACSTTCSIGVRQASTGSRCWCWTRPTACSTWASCPTSGASSAACRGSGRRCSSRPPCRRRSSTLAREILRNPVPINVERKAAPAIGITQAVYPVRAGAQARRCWSTLLRAATSIEQRRSSSPAPSTAPTASPSFLERHGVAVRPHPRQPQPGAAHRGAGRLQARASARCWWRPTSRRAASTSTSSPTSSTSTCPTVPDDYIHRVGRTARAERDRATPSPSCRPTRWGTCGHRAGGRQARCRARHWPASTTRSGRPSGSRSRSAERIAAIRARKSEERARGRTNASRRSANLVGHRAR